MYIVAWTVEEPNGGFRDQWEVRDSAREAESLYEIVLSLENLFTASICAVVKSTDYCPAE